MKILLILILSVISLPQSLLFAQSSERHELREITFSGNQKISSGGLRDIIYSEETPMWFWKFLNSFSGFGAPPIYFDITTIQYDLRALADYYTSNGFFQADFSTNHDTLEDGVYLKYEIQEGPQSKFGEIEFFGFPKNDSLFVMEALRGFKIDSTQFFNQAAIKSGIDNIILYLENNGYMLAKFDSTIILRDTMDLRAHLLIYLTTGVKYSISSILIDKSGQGSDDVEDELLTDIVGIKQGEVYSLEKIRLSQVRLYRTGLFSSVILNPVFEDTVDRSVPLKVVGSIGYLHEFAPELLMNNQSNTFNVGIGGTFIKKNLFGNARKFSTSGSAGYRDLFKTNFDRMIKTFSLTDTTIQGFIDGTVKIEQPYIFNRPILGIFETYFRINKELTSNKRNYGGKLSFEFELPRYTFINFITAYYNLEIADELFLTSDGLKSLNKTLSVLGADLRSSHVDNPLFPTSGYNYSFLVEEANLLDYGVSKLFSAGFDESLFYKLAVTGAFYTSLNRNRTSILGGKIKVGHIQTYLGDDAGVPTTRRFTAGGSNSIRGWAARQLAPLETRLLDGEEIIIQGGNFILECSMELRAKFANDFGVVLFTDVGNVWKKNSDFNFKTVTAAGGVGFRYYSPFAPFRIDFGIKLYDPYDNRAIGKKKFLGELMEYHFGIGEAF